VDQVARQASRSVVAISVQRMETRSKVRPGEPAVRIHTRVGSGVAIDESSILTTASVVVGAEHIFVRTYNGLQVEAQLRGLDLVFNIAVLNVPDLRLPWLRIAGSPAQLGDRVIAIGTTYNAKSTQSVGTVEYVYREPRTSLLQLTNMVQPGNSGGAALNIRGELIGIIQGELGSPEIGSFGGGGERRPSGMSFVMPVRELQAVYESLVRQGRMPHGYLGVSTREEIVTSDVDNAEIGLGARVESVLPGGPAERAGLRRGDLIVGFDTDRVEYPEQLARWVAETSPGTPVNLVWVRGEARRSGRTALGESPDSLPAWALGPGRRVPGPPAVPAVGDSPRR
jgi:S1-C subfamily serine protease